MDIVFVTGNQRKVWQAQTCLEEFGIKVQAKECEVDEIQSHDPIKITYAKAQAAHEVLKTPLVVNDHSWSIPALKGFPGGYMKDMNQWLEPEDFLALMAPKSDRSGILTENVVYYDGKEFKLFSTEFHGKFIDEVRGVGHVSMERVFKFDTSELTIAEHIDRGEHAREMENSAWKQFGAWYVKKDL